MDYGGSPRRDTPVRAGNLVERDAIKTKNGKKTNKDALAVQQTQIGVVFV